MNLDFYLQNKIFFYSHQKLNRFLQNEIRNYYLKKNKKQKIIIRREFCILCDRYHRIPKHFMC